VAEQGKWKNYLARPVVQGEIPKWYDRRCKVGPEKCVQKNRDIGIIGSLRDIAVIGKPKNIYRG
jgi:hypothetical protein